MNNDELNRKMRDAMGSNEDEMHPMLSPQDQAAWDALGGIDLSKRVSGIGFSNTDGTETFFVRVYDKFPGMEVQHIEGRRVVEISVELFINLVEGKGFYPVDPATGKITVPQEEGDTNGS